MPRPLMLSLLVAGILSLQAIPTHALYTDAATLGANTFTTATLQPPTDLSATASCAGALQAKITLSWTATTSTFADGYDVYRSTTDGGPYTLIDHVDGLTTTETVDNGLSTGTTYHYVLQSTAQGWVSVNSTQASATTPVLCL